MNAKDLKVRGRTLEELHQLLDLVDVDSAQLLQLEHAVLADEVGIGRSRLRHVSPRVSATLHLPSG